VLNDEGEQLKVAGVDLHNKTAYSPSDFRSSFLIFQIQFLNQGQVNAANAAGL
jgi:hypothetical protein